MIGHNCHNSFTDRAYEKISRLEQLRFLDLCGAQVFMCFYNIIRYNYDDYDLCNSIIDKKRYLFQNLSDSSLYQIARCKNLVSLNLTWLVSSLS